MDEDIRENIGPVPRYLASTNRQPILVASVLVMPLGHVAFGYGAGQGVDS